MAQSLTMKFLAEHMLEGKLIQGEEVAIKIDQTLTQDSTGTMAYLQLESMEVEDIKTEKSVAYIDHNILQSGFENADDHQFIQSAAAKYGITFSKPGGGICHQVHLEQFAKPGKTLLGSDSHTPTAGGLACLAIGAGGLDVAVAMARGYYYLKVPKVFNIILKGQLPKNCNAKDIILTILGRLSVKGGTNYIMEYSGPGLKSLSVTDRATICNMGAELGATSSIFPSDNKTLEHLQRHGREKDFIPLSADKGATYDKTMELDLNSILPSVARPHLPDNYSKIENLNKIKVDQVAIGSCTNSSFKDMMKVASILKGRKVHPDVSLVIAPGSATILRHLSDNGALSTMIESGARILESACGPCIGMGQSPKSKGISLRSFNRNFKGRSGTVDAQVYIASPETCAVSAVLGYIAEPNQLDYESNFEEPHQFIHPESYLIQPLEKEKRPKKTIMGPNIKPFPVAKPLEDTIVSRIIFKGEDNITTDDICPSNASLLPFRSNIPHLSNFAFSTLTNHFKERAQKYGGGIVVGGENYGQGSSREHAALVPLYLGIKVVIAKSFARIHRSNLINAGILPLVFSDSKEYERLDELDTLRLHSTHASLKTGDFLLENVSKAINIKLFGHFSEREKNILIEGGYLNYSKKNKLEV